MSIYEDIQGLNNKWQDLRAIKLNRNTNKRKCWWNHQNFINKIWIFDGSFLISFTRLQTTNQLRNQKFFEKTTIVESSWKSWTTVVVCKTWFAHFAWVHIKEMKLLLHHPHTDFERYVFYICIMYRTLTKFSPFL